MQVRIGIQSAPRELTVEAEEDPDAVESALRSAVMAEGGVFALVNANGGKVLVPADKIAYVELGSVQPRRVGFAGS